MLVFGEIVAIKGHQARLRLSQYDNYETDWFFVPQLCTVSDKASNVLEIGTLVGAVTTENFDDGCIIGALYNDQDICVTDDKNIKSIVFSDGTIIKYDKKEHIFTMDVKENIDITCKNSDIKSTTEMDITSPKLTINASSSVNITTPTLTLTGNLSVSGNITSGGQVSDVKSSMQAMRNTYNSHTHGNGNNGANTNAPNSSM